MTRVSRRDRKCNEREREGEKNHNKPPAPAATLDDGHPDWPTDRRAVAAVSYTVKLIPPQFRHPHTYFHFLLRPSSSESLHTYTHTHLVLTVRMLDQIANRWSFRGGGRMDGPPWNCECASSKFSIKGKWIFLMWSPNFGARERQRVSENFLLFPPSAGCWPRMTIWEDHCPCLLHQMEIFELFSI